jgi:hypothetical protein
VPEVTAKYSLFEGSKGLLEEGGKDKCVTGDWEGTF